MHIDNCEEIYTVFSDCPQSLKSNLYRVSDLSFSVYAVADSEEQALDNLADNDKLLSIEFDEDEDEAEDENLTPLGSYCRKYDLQYTKIEKIDVEKLGSFSDFIGNVLEDKLNALHNLASR
jgi:ADP-glucose pyrophosphorylase